ncbi:MAG TPA: DUF1295 domain-containing protein [Verrucomicrobiae bacterium]|jgi:steroid 5-alpha reductase family enzyme|nr:DUF1295 domain-containing protein [Verrucomicrobiae bacterium]
MHIVLVALIVSIGMNLVLFVPAYLYKTDKLTDLSYSATFIVVAVSSFLASRRTAVQAVALLLVLLWAVRLGGYLVFRIHKMRRDKRFDGMREDFWAFFRFWLYQGITVFAVLLASILLWERKTTVINGVAVAGMVLFAIGLLLESAADVQKYRFKQAGHSKTWIDSGVWRICRHPNYLGEILVWLGIYLFALPSLTTASKLLALISPLFIISILRFVSGIPLLEKSADQKWGTDKAYQAYKREVPLLLPTAASLRR